MDGLSYFEHSMITDINQLDFNKRYTYADYLTWQFKERVELLRGRIFRMSPAPNRRHQRILSNLFSPIYIMLEKNQCEVYPAPFDVVLSKNGLDTVVQPDISVICDRDKLTELGCTGAPDIIIEILSPGNTRKEMKEKFELYEENGVKEYWIADPERSSISIYSLSREGKYVGSKPFVGEECVESDVLKEFSLTMDTVFKE